MESLEQSKWNGMSNSGVIGPESVRVESVEQSKWNGMSKSRVSGPE